MHSAILRPSLSYHLSLRYLFGLFLSVRFTKVLHMVYTGFTQVLLYFHYVLADMWLFPFSISSFRSNMLVCYIGVWYFLVKSKFLFI